MVGGELHHLGFSAKSCCLDKLDGSDAAEQRSLGALFSPSPKGKIRRGRGCNRRKARTSWFSVQKIVWRGREDESFEQRERIISISGLRFRVRVKREE